jgi:hypothetical protein
MAALCLTGCKGFWDALPSTGSGTTTTTTLTSGYFYVLNVASNQLAGLYVSAGTLSVIPNCTSSCTFDLGAAPLAVAVSPNNAFLYVSTLGGIFVYSINSSTGQLTLASTSGAISSDPAVSMQVDSTNSWLVESFPSLQGSNASLLAIPLNPTTGLPASSWLRWVPAARRSFLSTPATPAHSDRWVRKTS